MSSPSAPTASDASGNTCDLCDLHLHDSSGSFRVLPPVFHSYGRRTRFAGLISTVKCFEDNTAVKAALQEPGLGRVLVVDGGGSLRRALVGGNMAASAAKNGWAGIVVDGCVRDSAELAAADVGIRALALMPLPTDRQNQGLRDGVLSIQGITVRPGEWLVSDEDGIVVLPTAP
jgi:regulator of ribonuclease activity A